MSLVTISVGNLVLETTDNHRQSVIEPMSCTKTKELGFSIFAGKENEINILEHEMGDVLMVENAKGKSLEDYIYGGPWEEATNNVFLAITPKFLTLLNEIIAACDEDYPDAVAYYSQQKGAAERQKAILAWMHFICKEASLMLTKEPTLHIYFDS